ncbi:hypothetical protein ACJX0J_012276, partial [Zea mays]
MIGAFSLLLEGTQVQLPSGSMRTLQDMFGACDFTTNAYHHYTLYSECINTIFLWPIDIIFHIGGNGRPQQKSESKIQIFEQEKVEKGYSRCIATSPRQKSHNMISSLTETSIAQRMISYHTALTFLHCNLNNISTGTVAVTAAELETPIADTSLGSKSVAQNARSELNM